MPFALVRFGVFNKDRTCSKLGLPTSGYGCHILVATEDVGSTGKKILLPPSVVVQQLIVDDPSDDYWILEMRDVQVQLWKNEQLCGMSRQHFHFISPPKHSPTSITTNMGASSSSPSVSVSRFFSCYFLGCGSFVHLFYS
jgi:hypothetical protein